MLPGSFFDPGCSLLYNFSVINCNNPVGQFGYGWIMTLLEVLAVLLVFAVAKRKLLSESLMGKLE